MISVKLKKRDTPLPRLRYDGTMISWGSISSDPQGIPRKRGRGIPPPKSPVLQHWATYIMDCHSQNLATLVTSKVWAVCSEEETTRKTQLRRKQLRDYYDSNTRVTRPKLCSCGSCFKKFRLFKMENAFKKISQRTQRVIRNRVVVNRIINTLISACRSVGRTHERITKQRATARESEKIFV